MITKKIIDKIFELLVIFFLLGVVIIPFALISFFFGNKGKFGCIEEADTSSGISFIIDAKNYGNFVIDQGYVHSAGGQRAAWFDTERKTNGDEFHIEISGNWMPWATTEVIGDAEAILENPCKIAVVNEGSEAFGSNGEFDYITDTHTLLEKTQEKVPLSPDEQKECQLHGGEGLYIGFFGEDGFQMPEVVHHLKGNQLFRCSAQFRHDLNNDGKIDKEECYEEAVENGIPYKVNKAIAVYKTPNFIKNTDGDLVGSNESVKLLILDKYYSDNIGAYKVTFYRGLGKKDGGAGLFEQIIKAIEDVFMGEIDADTGKREEGVVQKIYNNIILNRFFVDAVRMIVILYIAFTGFGMMMGFTAVSGEAINPNEIMIRLFKIAFVLAFTTPNGWALFDRYIMAFFFDGIGAVNAGLTSIVNQTMNRYGNINLVSLSGTFSRSNAPRFAFVDRTFDLLLNPFGTASVATKIAGLLFIDWYGPVLVMVFYVLILYYLFILFQSVYVYLVSLIQAIFALSLSPIFISFVLFEKTNHMFKKWLVFVASRFFEISMLFLFLYTMNTFVVNKIIALLDFNACYIPLAKAFEDRITPLMSSVIKMLGLNVPILQASGTQKMGYYAIEILTLFVIIKLFQYLLDVLNSVTSSIFQVWGEEFISSGLKATGFIPNSATKLLNKFSNFVTKGLAGRGIYKPIKLFPMTGETSYLSRKFKAADQFIGKKLTSLFTMRTAEETNFIRNQGREILSNVLNDVYSQIPGDLRQFELAKESRRKQVKQGLKKAETDEAVAHKEDIEAGISKREELLKGRVKNRTLNSREKKNIDEQMKKAEDYNKLLSEIQNIKDRDNIIERQGAENYEKVLADIDSKDGKLKLVFEPVVKTAKELLRLKQEIATTEEKLKSLKKGDEKEKSDIESQLEKKRKQAAEMQKKMEDFDEKLKKIEEYVAQKASANVHR